MIAGVTVFVIRYFLAQPFLVSGASMAANFNSGDYLVVDEITYRFDGPKRGDVIVFRYPNDPGTFYIKRIVGLPGEKIKVEDGSVYVDGKKIEEPYLGEEVKTLGDADIVLGESKYFVLGDNRYHSFDSRSWGLLDKKHIVGLARLRLFPFNAIGILDRPAYNE